MVGCGWAEDRHDRRVIRRTVRQQTSVHHVEREIVKDEVDVRRDRSKPGRPTAVPRDAPAKAGDGLRHVGVPVTSQHLHGSAVRRFIEVAGDDRRKAGIQIQFVQQCFDLSETIARVRDPAKGVRVRWSKVDGRDLDYAMRGLDSCGYEAVRHAVLIDSAIRLRDETKGRRDRGIPRGVIRAISSRLRTAPVIVEFAIRQLLPEARVQRGGNLLQHHHLRVGLQNRFQRRGDVPLFQEHVPSEHRDEVGRRPGGVRCAELRRRNASERRRHHESNGGNRARVRHRG